MKRLYLFLAAIVFVAGTAISQTLKVTVGDVTYLFPSSQTGDMPYSNGTTVTIMEKAFNLADVTAMTVDETPVDDSVINVAYDSTSAKVTVAGNIAKYVTPVVSGAHVSIAQSVDLAQEITYNLSGTATDGEFYMSGSYKATLVLNGLTLTNVTPVYSGAAIHIQNGKRIKVKVADGTVNNLTDNAAGTQKGCLYIKGHGEFAQSGTLNVTANLKHGVKTGEYFQMKNCTINILKAPGDGINSSQFMLIESGTLNLNNLGDDGMQCDLDGLTSTGITTGHVDEDTGNVYILGGTINITSTAVAAKGIKSNGSMDISGGDITIKTTGSGMWDTTDLETKAASGLSSDIDLTISGGNIKITSTGPGGKGMKCDGLLTVTNGTINITTSGTLYYNNGTTENTNYTGNTDNVNSNYYSSPKGVKADNGVEIGGGTIYVTTSGRNGEGIESKSYLNITGGHIIVNAYDDGINSANDLTISGGYIFSRATNNDGIDANGNCYINGGVIYAVGANSPELAVDANSEQQKKLYFSGGTLVALGGLESGCSLTQTCYSSSSWSKNVWYALYNNGELALAFKTPASGGTVMVVSTSGTTTVKSSVTVSGGVEYFGGMGIIDGTVTGGSSVTLSQYTGANGGGGPGGGGGRPGRP